MDKEQLTGGPDEVAVVVLPNSGFRPLKGGGKGWSVTLWKGVQNKVDSMAWASEWQSKAIKSLNYQNVMAKSTLVSL